MATSCGGSGATTVCIVSEREGTGGEKRLSLIPFCFFFGEGVDTSTALEEEAEEGQQLCNRRRQAHGGRLDHVAAEEQQQEGGGGSVDDDDDQIFPSRAPHHLIKWQMTSGA